MKHNQTIIGIRLGKPIKYFASLEEVTEITGIKQNTIYNVINKGTETNTGWCLDYAID